MTRPKPDPDWRVLALCAADEAADASGLAAHYLDSTWGYRVRPADAAAHLRKAALSAIEALLFIEEHGSPLARQRARTALVVCMAKLGWS